MKTLLIFAATMLAVLLPGGASSHPSILQLRIGMSSDSAIAVIGGDLVRDTTWTGVVRRRVEAIGLRPVTYYGIAGRVSLVLTKHGTLEDATWFGGEPFRQRSHRTDLTREDFELVRDSLTAIFGYEPGTPLGVDDWLSWDDRDRSVSCSINPLCMTISLSQPSASSLAPKSKSKSKRKR